MAGILVTWPPRRARSISRPINPTRVPIEEKESIRRLRNLEQSTELLGDPERRVHIGVREADIFELFWTAQQAGTPFVDRAGTFLLQQWRNLQQAGRPKS
jgi:hypothetical protein